MKKEKIIFEPSSMKREKKIKAWAIISQPRKNSIIIENAWDLLGEDNEFYTPLAVFSSKREAKEYLDYEIRKNGEKCIYPCSQRLKIIKVEIIYAPTPNKKTK